MQREQFISFFPMIEWIGLYRESHLTKYANRPRHMIAETPYLASYRKRAVCEDWMVVCAVRYEPVSEAKIPDNREKYREKRKNKRN
jgi:hypothetical protein